MDIKEIALKVADSLRNKIGGISHMQSNQGLVRFAEALVAELAKQNEPVLYAEFAEDGGWLGVASEYQDYLEEPHELYTSNQVAAAILKATKPLEERLSWLDYTEKMNKALVVEIEELHAQLAAAQEEIKTVTEQKNRMWFEMQSAQNQLAKAEQRVAESCASFSEDCYEGELGVRIGKEIADDLRQGEWRKFMKGE